MTNKEAQPDFYIDAMNENNDIPSLLLIALSQKGIFPPQRCRGVFQFGNEAFGGCSETQVSWIVNCIRSVE